MLRFERSFHSPKGLGMSPDSNKNEVATAAQALIDDGFAVVRLQTASKQPKEIGWLDKTYTASDFQPSDNIDI